MYELDGLKPLPISHGVFEGDWTELAKQLVSPFLANRLKIVRLCAHSFFPSLSEE